MSTTSAANAGDRKASARNQTTANNNTANQQKPSAQKADHHENLDEYTIGCPPGLYRLFISSSAQTLLSIRADEDITQEDNIKQVAKQLLLDDINKKMATWYLTEPLDNSLKLKNVFSLVNGGFFGHFLR